jgi:hypothetical protein
MRAHRFSCTPLRHLLLGLALLPAGCVIHSDVPLSDPDKATPNEKLLGKWLSQSRDNPFTLIVRRAPEGYPAGIQMLSLNDGNPGNYTLLFTTELKGQTYANLWGGWVRKPADLPPWDKARKGQCGIVNYTVEDDTAVLWPPNEKLLQELVRTGKRKGVIQQPEPGSYGGPIAVLKEPTQDLAQFVVCEDEQLFPAKGSFRRVK